MEPLFCRWDQQPLLSESLLILWAPSWHSKTCSGSVRRTEFISPCYMKVLQNKLLEVPLPRKFKFVLFKFRKLQVLLACQVYQKIYCRQNHQLAISNTNPYPAGSWLTEKYNNWLHEEIMLGKYVTHISMSSPLTGTGDKEDRHCWLWFTNDLVDTPTLSRMVEL